MAPLVSWAADRQVVLKYWTWYPASEILQPALDTFEKENPGIKVELTVLESKAYQEKLPIALSSGEQLDLVGIQMGQMPGQLKNYLEPLEPVLARNDKDCQKKIKAGDIAKLRDQTGGGDLYMLCLGQIADAVGYYNVDLFKMLFLLLSLETLGGWIPWY